MLGDHNVNLEGLECDDRETYHRDLCLAHFRQVERNRTRLKRVRTIERR